MTDRELDVMAGFDDVTAPPQDASAAEARRRKIVGRMQSTIRAEAAAGEARKKRARVAWAISVAAGLVLALGGAWRLAGSKPQAVAPTRASVGRVASATGAVVITHGGRADAVTAPVDVSLDAEDELATTPEARARMVMTSGATVELASGTRVRLPSAVAPGAKAERVAISSGEVLVHVPKLGPNESFRVETPDSEVTVHGTSFVVSVREGATRVRVSEGVVSVMHAGSERFLHAGEEWPPPPAPAAPFEATSPSVAPSAPPAVRPAPVRLPRTDPSTLAEQNRLLQSALDSRRRGDDSHAIETLDVLLGRYPGSPVVQEARVEKFRALERSGQHAKAVSEARRYLADYPKGFAVEEAKTLALH